MKVKAKHDFTHQGKQHKQGDVLDVPPDQAKQLQDAGHADPHTEERQEHPSSSTTGPKQQDK